MVQFGLMFLLFVNDSVFPEGMRQNKLGYCFAIFLIGNMVTGALTKTNAFEIYVGSRPVWSTVKAGRMPEMRDLVKGFAKVGIKLKQH